MNEVRFRVLYAFDVARGVLADGAARLAYRLSLLANRVAPPAFDVEQDDSAAALQTAALIVEVEYWRGAYAALEEQARPRTCSPAQLSAAIEQLAWAARAAGARFN